jgi:DNA-binding transcriptional LysR family regulator
MKSSANQLALMNTFVRVVSAGSLSAAARQLGTTQPTVSRQISNLEDIVGVQLISRSTHSLRLTDEGQRYFSYAEGMIAEMTAFEDDLRGTATEPTGYLRVQVPTAFGQDWLVEIAHDFLKTCPAVQLEWRLSDSPSKFTEEGIDCAIRVGTPKDDTVIARLLGTVHRVIAAAPSLLAKHDEISRPEELLTLPWVSLSTYYTDRLSLRDQFGNTRELTISPKFSADHVLTTRTAAKLGIGAVLISEWAVRTDLESGDLVRLVPQWFGPPVPIYLIYPRSRYYPIKLRKFIDITRLIVPRFFGQGAEQTSS